MKSNRIYTGISVFFSLLLLLAFIPKADEPLDKIVASLQQWFDTHPQEKIYLHTDKPYYLVGDTIWFKAYLTTGSKHQLSAISGAMYVDLINEGDSIAKQLKLPVTSGMAVGNFVLSDSLIREGNYRIRAYTNWMRNAGPAYFYDRTFIIGNSISNTVFAKIDYIYAKEGTNTKIRALLKYTDERGTPFADKQVRYQLKDGYEVLTFGGAKTNAAGEITVNLPNAKPGLLSKSYLMTKISLAGDETIAKTFPIKTASLQTDVQFFPESGNLVNGVKSKVAFKATGTNGLGVAIGGSIVDNTGQEVAKIEAKHLGMGYFYLTPGVGKTYQAKVTYPDGVTNTLNLPAVTDDGYVLSVNHLKKDSLSVRVQAGAAALRSGTRTLSLVGQSGGKVYFSVNVPVNKPTTSLYFPTTGIPTGILQFTIFSPAGDPLNERITFIENKDNIDLKITSAKQVYHRREKVDLNIDAKDGYGKPVGGNFSVSVRSETAVPSDEANENSIFSQLLLSADIKGYIEKPNYYFYNPNDETRANLDILMLTQGYRRFVWNDVITNPIAANAYKPEKLVNDISGTLMGYNKKPIAGGKVILINNKLGFTRDTVTDADGRFKFGNLIITDGVDFTIQGTTAHNGKHLKTMVDEIKKPNIIANANIGDVNADMLSLVKASVDNNLTQDMELEKYGIPSQRQLREVKIRAAKKRGFNAGITENQADEVFRPDARMPCATLRECLEEMFKSRVRFIQEANDDCGLVWRPRNYGANYVVIIDGQLIFDPCDYQAFFLDSTANVNKIYLVHESAAIEAMAIGAGNLNRIGGKPQPVMSIFTKNGAFRMSDDPSIVYYTPKGYDYTKEFYSPKYDNAKNQPQAADLRSTVYWNPRVLTRSVGQAKVSYFNSDQTGTYRVTIEGINADGQLARQVYRYKVQ
ncbi:carboxypeptidase-like regulatory domain-containing protein [Mucilaginibacter sp. UYCu711]|uniref:carboxypeptidase-like regulatory domain-containing protein n=1 Tax=Mucilaginibacter sp. UYCu711 TaxID=3156339 RepID=UPI003D1B1378